MTEDEILHRVKICISVNMFKNQLKGHAQQQALT